MNYHQEWAEENDELSEFDLANSADPPGDDDPEAPVTDPEPPDEADPADAADQLVIIQFGEDDESPEQ
ncbi:hypothetical protein [Glycomyces sp. NPDC047010]|uniref:hypothetical protein n=1 Tax=Glycomyces sp. NPDC047010 TaxID=3155023 RepID=UPI0033F7C46D